MLHERVDDSWPSPSKARAGLYRFLNAVTRSRQVGEPFDYWLLENVLPDALVDELTSLPFAPPTDAGFDGRRETNNSARAYFSPQNQALSPAVRQTADLFAEPLLVCSLSRLTGADLSKGRLRIEYCQDVDGFWLEPHVDISAKLVTLLIYLSDDPRLADAGTDIYDATPEHRPVARSAYRRNAGLLFIPSHNTWHGFTPRPIASVRKSLIVNYVSPAWRNVEELAFP